LCAFDEISDDKLGEPAQAAPQLDGFGKAERMGRRERESDRKRVPGEIEPVDPARLSDRRHSIDDDDGGDPLPVLDQGEGIDAAFEDADPRRDPPPEPPCNGWPDAIVATVGVADPDDEHQRPIAAAHSRCTCSFRKCAAQEMQGS